MQVLWNIYVHIPLIGVYNLCIYDLLKINIPSLYVRYIFSLYVRYIFSIYVRYGFSIYMRYGFSIYVRYGFTNP